MIEEWYLPPLVIFPDNLLTTPAIAGKHDGSGAAIAAYSALAQTMVRAMYHYGGRGLAANQIGCWERIFVMIMDDKELTLIDPIITSQTRETETAEESCLSFPGITATIERPKGVGISYVNQYNAAQSIYLSDINARCAQHEIDHLNGITILDRCKPVLRDILRRKYAKLSRRRAQWLKAIEKKNA